MIDTSPRSLVQPRVLARYAPPAEAGEPLDLVRLVGVAGEFKEGDQALGLAATDRAERQRARGTVANLRIEEFGGTLGNPSPLFQDELERTISQAVDLKVYETIKDWSLGQLKNTLLQASERRIQEIMPGLPSDVIATVVKLMSNEELTAVAQKVFNPLPGSNIGAKGYLGARVQPNSPTDHPDDILWQVLDAWSYGVGDVMLGNNPVGGTVESVTGVELTLKDVLETFGLQKQMPWVVLSHIDIQDKVEKAHPGSTALFFQSVAGTDTANQVFDVSAAKMMNYAAQRVGSYGLYLETGQGADFTNGQAHGIDMGTLEARKYGLARAMKKVMGPEQWLLLNDVAGFIGPEVFRTKEQLVRVALEDTVMGKLHGLPIGLDICSTLHMSIGLDDLDWAMDRILPANPAYLMALPTKNDPMLSYLTTSFQDHVRLREKFGYKVNEPMQKFFQELEVVDQHGRPTEHFGDPVWVYQKYRQKKGDLRPAEQICQEGREKMSQVQARGVPLAVGHGPRSWDMEPKLENEIRGLVSSAQKNIWSNLSPEFLSAIPNAVYLTTQSKDREDYILHPPSGEVLGAASLEKLKEVLPGFDTYIVISDGLNSKAISDPGHLAPFLATLRHQLEADGRRVSPQNLVVQNGRVRAGYRIGEALFAQAEGADKTIVHVIGERPGTPHDNYSAYVASASPEVWSQPSLMDHGQASVVSGISDTALDPAKAARQVGRLLTTENRKIDRPN